jgi:hypothetical protein
MTLQLIVEGKGEIAASRELIQRLMTQAQCFDFQVARPIRRPSSDLVKPEGIAKAVELAHLTHQLSAILIIFDGDLDIPRPGSTPSAFCPKTDVHNLLTAARGAARGVPCEIVVAYKEYESWLLAGIEGIRGKHGVAADATCPANLDQIRNAKGTLAELMINPKTYLSTVDQTAMTHEFDLGNAYRRSRSFRKLVRAFGELHSAVGRPLLYWQPESW